MSCRQDKKRYVGYVREHASDLATGLCPPALLSGLAKTYFGFDCGHMSSNPADALCDSLDSDRRLTSVVLSGFRRLAERNDLPGLDEVVRLDEDGRYSLLALPVLAGLAEGDRTGNRDLRRLTEDGIKRVAGFYFTSPRPMVRDPRGGYRRAEAPAWYDSLVQSHAELVAESLVAVHSSKIKRKQHCEEHLAPLAWNPKYEELARLSAPALLRAFPIRCTRPQIAALRHVLWALVRCMPDQLASRAGKKLARPGMDVAQRALWLGAGMLASPRRYMSAAMEFVSRGSLARVEHIAAVLVPDAGPRFSMEWSAEHLAMAVRGVGARVEPGSAGKVERLICGWLAELAKTPGTDAADALKNLAAAPQLAPWRHHVLGARNQQAILRRVP